MVILVFYKCKSYFSDLEVYSNYFSVLELYNSYFTVLEVLLGHESRIFLDLVLFADRTNAEPKSYLSILWDIGGLQRFERRVYIF